jgi:FkbM family methyltransferase
MQPVWEKLHRLALWGKNIGPAGSVRFSGEEWALCWCVNSAPAGAPFVLFDAGANKGQYATHALAVLGNRVQAHCFEPSPKTFAELAANLAGRKQVKLLPFGLSSQPCELQLYSHPGGSAEASLTRRDLSHWGLEQSIVETVTLRTLDDYCRESGIQRIDFLKIDVEGHEIEVLRGGTQMLRTRRIRKIQFEFGSPDIESRTFFKDIFQLLNPHYRIHRIVYEGLVPIDAYSEFHETFATANFLAVAR